MVIMMFYHNCIQLSFVQFSLLFSFIIILGMTMKAVALESLTEINGFVKKLNSHILRYGFHPKLLC